jgi:transcriptional regulator with XRE-family HTH domain
VTRKDAKKKRERDVDNARFGAYLRERREAAGISLRGLAGRLGVQPAYLSEVERGDVSVSERIAMEAAQALGDDPDVMFAMSGRVSSDLVTVITKRPKLFAQMIRQLKEAPDHAILRVVREVRDGEW